MYLKTNVDIITAESSRRNGMCKVKKRRIMCRHLIRQPNLEHLAMAGNGSERSRHSYVCVQVDIIYNYSISLATVAHSGTRHNA